MVCVHMLMTLVCVHAAATAAVCVWVYAPAGIAAWSQAAHQLEHKRACGKLGAPPDGRDGRAAGA